MLMRIAVCGPEEGQSTLFSCSGWLVLHQILPAMALALFCLTVRVLSQSFRTLRRDVDRWPAPTADRPRLDAQLRAWKRRHRALCHAVGRLERCFGAVLLCQSLFTVFASMNAIFYVWQSMLSLDSSVVFAAAAILADILLIFAAVTFSVHRLTNQVSSRSLKASLFDQIFTRTARYPSKSLPERFAIGS